MRKTTRRALRKAVRTRRRVPTRRMGEADTDEDEFALVDSAGGGDKETQGD